MLLNLTLSCIYMFNIYIPWYIFNIYIGRLYNSHLIAPITNINSTIVNLNINYSDNSIITIIKKHISKYYN